MHVVLIVTTAEGKQPLLGAEFGATRTWRMFSAFMPPSFDVMDGKVAGV